jgi:hypothetical protein
MARAQRHARGARDHADSARARRARPLAEVTEHGIRLRAIDPEGLVDRRLKGLCEAAQASHLVFCSCQEMVTFTR